MKHFRLILFSASILALAVTLSATRGQQKQKENIPASPPAEMGKKDTSKWTDTTVAAATTPEQKAVLHGGKVTTVTGELVEVSCYLQVGKRGEKHLPCGTECLKNGQPFGVLTPSKTLYLVMAEEHDPRRHGEADLREALIPLLAKQVKITGMHTMSNGYHAIYVQAFELPGGKKESPK